MFNMIVLEGEQFGRGLVLDSANINWVMNHEKMVFKAKANRTFTWYFTPTSKWNLHTMTTIETKYTEKYKDDPDRWDASFFNNIMGPN